MLKKIIRDVASHSLGLEVLEDDSLPGILAQIQEFLEQPIPDSNQILKDSKLTKKMLGISSDETLFSKFTEFNDEIKKLNQTISDLEIKIHNLQNENTANENEKNVFMQKESDCRQWREWGESIFKNFAHGQIYETDKDIQCYIFEKFLSSVSSTFLTNQVTLLQSQKSISKQFLGSNYTKYFIDPRSKASKNEGLKSFPEIPKSRPVLESHRPIWFALKFTQICRSQKHIPSGQNVSRANSRTSRHDDIRIE